MDSVVVKAQAEGIIWLIVGIFWVIAQIAGGAAKKKVSGSTLFDRQPDEDESPGGEDPFADLMKRLGGQEFAVPKPPKPVALKTQKPWKPGEIEALPDVQPIRRIIPVPAAKPAELLAVDVRPTMSSFKSAMPSMKLPAMKLCFQPLEKSGANVPTIGKIIDPADRQTLRRAILGHIILGKPKALEGWNTGTVE